VIVYFYVFLSAPAYGEIQDEADFSELAGGFLQTGRGFLNGGIIFRNPVELSVISSGNYPRVAQATDILQAGHLN
jgi:hypothetical protein